LEEKNNGLFLQMKTIPMYSAMSQVTVQLEKTRIIYNNLKKGLTDIKVWHRRK